MILHSRSKMKTGDRMSVSGYLPMVSTQTAMNSLVSDSVPENTKRRLVLRNEMG